MILTVFRHGEAADAASDYARRLTARGERDVECAGQALATACRQRELPPPDTLYSSPWIRTMATADILSSTLQTPLAEAVDALQPGVTANSVETWLQPRFPAVVSAPGHILIVSHQPLVSRLISRWLDDAGRVPALSPGAFATLEMDIPAQGAARLLFRASPPDCEPSL